MNNLRILNNTNYINKDIQYLKNVNISEWDIHSAGLSVIKYYKLLPDDLISSLEKMDKHSRTVKEGKLQKENKELAKKIVDGLCNVRLAFGVANSLNENQILSIKKDAIFLINAIIKKPSINDIFVFREKGQYTSYINLNNREFYLSVDGSLDVKGISSDVKEKQKDYFLNDIRKILMAGEKLSADQLYIMIKSYRSKYLNRQLNIETYRDLSSGCFSVGRYDLDAVSSDMINDIDISQNYLNYIVPLINRML